MTIEEIQTQIDNVLNILATNSVSEIIEYTVGDKTIKKNRTELRKELAFWREELNRANKPSRTVYTRF